MVLMLLRSLATTGWSRLGDLQSIRRYHRAIINGDKVYVVGGNTAK